MNVKEGIYKGKFRSFKVVRDKDLQKDLLSVLSRVTVEIREVKEILLHVKRDTSYISKIRDDMRIMLEQQDSMLEKQDFLIQLTGEGFSSMVPATGAGA